MKLMILTALVCLISLSFKNPIKTSNNDLRTFETILSISEISGDEFKLQRSTDGQYLLSGLKDKNSITHKLSQSKARNIDESFVEGFVKLKYMMPAVDGECKVEFSLFMRGEATTICRKEKNKIAQSKKIVSLFNKYFKL